MASSPARFPRIARPPHCHAFRIGPAPAWPCLRRRSRRNGQRRVPPTREVTAAVALRQSDALHRRSHTAGRWVSGRSRAVRFNSVSRATAPSNRSSLHPPALSTPCPFNRSRARRARVLRPSSYRTVKRFTALSLGTILPEEAQCTRLTCPRPFLLRPPLRRLKVICSKGWAERQHGAYGESAGEGQNEVRWASWRELVGGM